ncbi:hypothetical protein ABT282_07455 [Streptomyces sp. NPDC000927]|uniref:hypothetical protein n=1 Tax=Streptomyces sp. NPDC000927 TaxID=3154371 RepID=UPI00332D3489
MKMKRNAPAGNAQWREFLAVLEAGRGGNGGRLPRGGAQVGPAPASDEPLSQLPEEWDGEVAHASLIVYHYGTPVAWVDGRDGGWVVPNEDYSPQTSGVQNRIRAHLGENGYRSN